MKILKVGVAALLTGILVLAVSFLCFAAQDQPMDKAEFASILVDILGIEMPAGADQLSDVELYEVQSNMLAESGITLFTGANPVSKVTKCNLADVLYDALVGPNEATIEEKFDYLANLGYLNVDNGYRCDVMKTSEIISTLNIPELTGAIAEGYSRPAIGSRAAAIAPAPFNPESQSPIVVPPPEEPLSPVGIR